MGHQINPFPYFTGFLEANLGTSVSCRLIDERERIERRWVGNVLLQLSSYNVILSGGQVKPPIGKIRTRLEGSPNEDDHFYYREVIYHGKLPTRRRLTRFKRKIKYEEQPETMTADRPVKQKVRQPWFYKYEFPPWIFDYVISSEQKFETRKT